MVPDLRVCFAHLLERVGVGDASSRGTAAGVQGRCFGIPRGAVVIAALGREDTADHLPEQRPQRRTAGGNDGEIHLDGAISVTDAVA